MLAQSERPLPFLALGRVRDSVTLAYYSTQEAEEQLENTKAIFQKLLKAASTKLKGGERTRLQWHDGSVCCLMDEQCQLLYCLVTSQLAYPEPLAYQLLYDLRVAVLQAGGLDTAEEHALNEQLQPCMRDLVAQYEDPRSFPQSPLPTEDGRPVESALPQGSAFRDNRVVKYAAVAFLFVLLLLVIITWRMGRKRA
mmetsp:Transcript_72775/g.168692  ORF Transcript_72775/g.168692 Transcript_72775/m.168692 type:complete len:196 (+) Transcript_72775:69-656(+)